MTAGQAHVLGLAFRCDMIVSRIVRLVPRDGEMSLDEMLDMLKGERKS